MLVQPLLARWHVSVHQDAFWVGKCWKGVQQDAGHGHEGRGQGFLDMYLDYILTFRVLGFTIFLLSLYIIRKKWRKDLLYNSVGDVYFKNCRLNLN